MADIQTATGTKIYIGPSVTNATDTTAEFAALSWVEVTLVEDAGEYGDQSSIVSGAVIGDGRMRKAKGARDAGDWTIVCFTAADDPGQQAMVAAEGTYANYAFKIIHPDRLTTGGTDGIDYLRGLVTSKRERIGTNDNIRRVTFAVGVNSQIYRVDPT